MTARAFVRVLRSIDESLADARSAFEIDRLVAARLVLTDGSVPRLGASTERAPQRRAFAKWCPGCERARSRRHFNRHRRKRDGLQTICRDCQRRVYQEHMGALAAPAAAPDPAGHE